MSLIPSGLPSKLNPYIKAAALLLFPLVICACSRGEDITTAAPPSASASAETANNEGIDIDQLNKSPIAPTRILPTPSQTSTATPTEIPPTPTIEPSPTPTPETPQSVALELGYSSEESINFVIRDEIPNEPGLLKELWSDTEGVKAFWTAESGWVPTSGWSDRIRKVVYNDRDFIGGGLQKASAPPPGGYFLQGVSGSAIDCNTPYYDKNGNLIMTSKLIAPFFYLDGWGRLVMTEAPYLANVNGNFKVLSEDCIRGGCKDVKDPIEQREIIDFFKQKLQFGKIETFFLRKNEQYPKGGGFNDEDMRAAWNNYQSSYAEEYSNFLKNGGEMDFIFFRITTSDFINGGIVISE